jgi:hypothetical protein
MPDELLERLRRFTSDAFPQYRSQFQQLVDNGQRPLVLFIGCSDARIVPYLLTSAGPGADNAGTGPYRDGDLPLDSSGVPALGT